MQTRIVLAVLAIILAAPVVVAAADSSRDPQRIMPVDEIRPGMTGVGRTTLKGAQITEFDVEVLAVIEKYGPKQDLILCQCSGAGLETSGIIAGMSGSPVTIDGRLIGAVAYAFSWSKAPICGVQPIEQMHGVMERYRHRPDPPAGSGVVAAGPSADSPPAAPGPAPAITVPAAALARADLAQGLAEREVYQMQPIRTPVMVSGLPRQAIDRLADDLAPYGLIPMAGGGTEHDLPAGAKLEPGAPLAVTMLRGDIEMTVMGTITDVVGDHLYGFGHSMFGLGEADYPMMTGVAKAVIPSLQRSFRMGAPVKEVGRLIWDEETAVLGRLGKERAHMVPVTVTVSGPGKGLERSYACEMIHSRDLSGLLAATAVSGGLLAHSDLPLDHTVRYRVRVKPVGHEAIVRENVAVSPSGGLQVSSVVRHVVGLVVENPFRNLRLESVEVEIRAERGRRFAEIEKARALRNTVRPGGTAPVELKIRPWRQPPRWITVNVRVPDDYPEGTYTVVLCGGDEALRQEQREAPTRFQADDLDSLLEVLGREKARDRLYVRLKRPGEGIAIGRDELPNLPDSMRSVLITAARQPVTSLTGSIVTTLPMDWVMEGGRQLTITVDRNAPE